MYGPDEERLRKLGELGDDIKKDLRRHEKRKGTTSIALLKEFSLGDLWVHGHPPGYSPSNPYLGHSRISFSLNCLLYWSQQYKVRLILIEDQTNEMSFPLEGEGIVTHPKTLEEIRRNAEESDLLIISDILRHSQDKVALWGMDPVPKTLKTMARNCNTGIFAMVPIPGNKYKSESEKSESNSKSRKFSLEDFRGPEAEFADVVTVASPLREIEGVSLQCLKNRGKPLFNSVSIYFKSGGMET